MLTVAESHPASVIFAIQFEQVKAVEENLVVIDTGMQPIEVQFSIVPAETPLPST